MMPSLGKEIKRLRKERSFLTQEELADKIGFSRTYLSDTESGRKIPSITFLNKVAVGLGISKLHLYKAAGYLDETDILNLIDENKRLRDALEQIANSDGWTLEPYPLCTAEQAHERCIEAATKALGVDNDGY